MKKLIEENDVKLFLNPTEQDILSLRIKIPDEIKNHQFLYVVQTSSFEDDNEYRSYIFSEKEGKTYIFFEYDNPEHHSFYTELEEVNYIDFKERMKELSSRYKINIIDHILEQDCNKLMSQLTEKQTVMDSKIKKSKL